MTRTLYRDVAMVDESTRRIQAGLSILVVEDRIAWIRPTDSEEDPGGEFDLIDGGGTTAIPGMVDAHSHLSLPGGSHYKDTASEDIVALWKVAEHNATLLYRAGVRWARDVGAPVRDGRAFSLTVRDAWRGKPGYPHVRAAGTWLTLKGTLGSGEAAEVEDGDGLFRAAQQQLDQGADLIKLYLDAPDQVSAPFTVLEVARVVALAESRGVKVTAHCGYLAGARVAAAAPVASIEHGFQLDDDIVRLMMANHVSLVSTLALFESDRTMASTTVLSLFASPEARATRAAKREWAQYSVGLAHRAGVMIAAGTDFGGSTLRANHLAWEVCTLVTAGLEPYDALRAATTNGGTLLGEPSAGVLREGGPADLILVHGDPLSDPSAMWRVWRVSW